MRERGADRFVVWTTVAVAVVNALIMLFTPYAGDDWRYRSCFSGPDFYEHSWSGFYNLCVDHWKMVNGRTGDFLCPILTNIPHWLLAGLCGLAIGMMCYQAISKAECSRRPVGAMIVLTALMWLLPWWDAFYVFAVHFNYVWSSVLILLTVGYITSGRKHSALKTVAVTALAIAAGAAHEGASVPVLIALCIYTLLNRGARGRHLLPMVGLALGICIVVFSPALSLRACDTDTNVGRMIEVVLMSDIIAVAMLLLLGVAVINKRWRKVVSVELQGVSGIYAGAAVISMGVSAWSGVEGRTGWFADLFALIAIMRIGLMIYDTYSPTVSRRRTMMAAGLLAAALLSQQGLTAAWQVRLGLEAEKVESEYLASEDGVVMEDVSGLYDISPLTLSRLRPVPDVNEAYLLATYKDYFRKPPLIVLPSEASEALESGEIGERLTLSRGSYIEPRKQEDGDTKTGSAREEDGDAEESATLAGNRIYEKAGKEWVAQEFSFRGRRFTYHTPRLFAPYPTADKEKERQ